jgi:hypothetical protein
MQAARHKWGSSAALLLCCDCASNGTLDDYMNRSREDYKPKEDQPARIARSMIKRLEIAIQIGQVSSLAHRGRTITTDCPVFSSSWGGAVNPWVTSCVLL